METEALIDIQKIQSDLPLLSLTENGESRIERNSKNSDDNCGRNKSVNIFTIDGCKFEVPGEMLMDKIMQQVEQLFSDSNILKDKFILKHIRRNKEGYVSLKLISSLRKVKALSKDWRVVAYSLQRSRKLQMNDKMTKIKRIEPLPVIETSNNSRTVLAFHSSCCTLESMRNMLNKFGTVTFISIVSSLAGVSSDIKKILHLYEKIISIPFAVVKFETSDEASNAVLQTSHPTSLLKIVSVQDDESKEATSSSIVSQDNGDGLNLCENSLSFQMSPKKYSKLKPSFDICVSSTNDKMKREDKKKTRSPRQVGKASSSSSLKETRNALIPCKYRGDGFINNSWLQRRQSAGLLKEPRVVVLRQPKGPDGTKGFHTRRISGTATLSKV